MKAVLISIQPKWCELIASGEKTVEVRKTKPKLETPFKVYIYCTKGRGDCLWRWGGVWYDTQFPNERPNRLDGKVIGEFVCDTFITDKTFGHDALFNAAACLSDADAASYCLNKEMYGWHISDLVIYDKPRELSEFYTVIENADCEKCRYYDTPCENEPCNQCQGGRKYLTRPPQSWCYVESEGAK